MTGSVKKIVADKGFGFLKADDGKEYFFHRSAMQGDFDSLKGGEKVEFDTTTGPKGPRAENVKLVA